MYDLPAATGAVTAQEFRRAAIIAELPFAAVVSVVAVTLAVLEPEVLRDRWLVAGLVLTGAIFLVTVSIRWERWPARALIAVPTAEMVALFLMHLSTLELAVLMVFPILRLAGGYGRAGLTLAITGAVLVGVDYDEFPGPPSEWAADVLRTVALVAVALTVRTLALLVRAHQEELVRREQVVSGLLAETSAQRRLLDRILDTIDTAVVVAAPDGRILLRNRAHRALTEADGPDGEDAPASEVSGDASVLRRALHGEPVSRELRWWERAGRRRALRVSAAPIVDDDGLVLQAVAALHDVTDEMEALAQREDLVAAVSHELRTPLTAIVGYLELAAETPGTPPDVQRSIAVALRSGNRLLDLVNDLLTAADLARETFTVTLRPTELRAVLDRSLESQRLVADRAGVRLTVTVDGDTAVDGDALRLGQVLDNLISNAVKYSGAGGRVDVDVAGTADGVRVVVADDGPGMDAETLSHLFERFYRSADARRGPVHGTGLGLHITHAIVTAHGGTVAVASAPGQGTTVTVTLRRASGPADPAGGVSPG